MIVDTESNSIQRGGITGERVFGFSFSKKMYDLVSTNLYSDRIGSTVRETCSNAWDAHTAAGKNNVPFKITLPTVLEPHFIVEDFGTGMPDEKAIDLYSTMGLSTKEQSNDMIGAFGLGSKVPFTVTDSFTVENTYEGKTYFYLCFKNEKGFPSILKTGETDTDKENGVKVTIPVAGTNYNSFIMAMKRQLIMMEPKPIITNGGAFEFPVAKKIYELPSGFVLENSWEFNLTGRTVYGKMGIVLYPIDLNQVGITEYERFHKNFSSSACVVLNFDIGELDPLPSREGLTYDVKSKTIESIRKKYKALKNELVEVSTKELNLFTEPFPAWERAKHVESILGFKFLSDGKIKIKGYTLGERIHAFPNYKLDVVVPEEKDSTGKVIQKARTYQTNHAQYPAWQRYRYRYGKKRRWDDVSIKDITFEQVKLILNGEFVIVLVDEEKPKKRYARMDLFYNQNSNKEICFVYIEEQSGKKKTDFADFIKAYDDFYPKLSEKFVKFSSIKIEHEKTKRDASVFKGVKYATSDRATFYNDLPIDEELDPDTTFYIEAARDNLIKYPSKELKHFTSFIKGSGYNAVLVRKGGIKAIASLEEEGIKEFETFINEKLNGQSFSPQYKDNTSAMDIYNTTIVRLTENEQNAISKLFKDDFNDNGKAFSKLYNRVVEVAFGNQTTYTKEERFALKILDSEFNGFFKEADWYKNNISTLKTDFVNALSQFRKDYPFFQILAHKFVSFPYNKRSTEVLNYIHDMDELREYRSKQVAQIEANKLEDPNDDIPVDMPIENEVNEETSME